MLAKVRSYEPRDSGGNGTLLVLVDSSRSEYWHVGDTVFAALDHCGMPYTQYDLATSRLEAVEFRHHAAVVIAQEHLGECLSPSGMGALLKAVEAGLGLVNFDHTVPNYGRAYADILGITGTRSSGRMELSGTEEIGVVGNDHFISYTHHGGVAHRLRMPVPVTAARAVQSDSRVIAESGAGGALLVARQVGRGRLVQWLVSPKVWLLQYFGHAHGLDDLFWKGIVWAARKPFVMNAMPPFVRLRFDDCNGLWRDAVDFRFVGVLNEFRHKPNLCICMGAITDDGAQKVAQLYERRLAEFAPHTLKPGTSIFWGDERGEYTESELQEIMQYVDSRLNRWGVTPSKILSDHDHEYSARALPFLKQRGICFKMNITLPGERWTDVHVDWQPGPYRSMSYALDYLPNTRDLFVVFNHYPTFDYARAYLPDGRFLYQRTGSFGSYKWDYLNGLTTHSGEQSANDIESCAQRLAIHTKLGLDSLFFGGSITHSHFAQDLSEAEWRQLLRRYEDLTARYEKRNVGYDFIAEYARSKHGTHLARVDVSAADGSVRCTLAGESTVPLELYVFRDRGDGVEHRFEPVPVFSGQTDVVVGS